MCFDNAMNHENHVSNMVGCLPVVRIYSFMKKNKTVCTNIIFLFAKSENNDFIKEIKHVISAFIAS